MNKYAPDPHIEVIERLMEKRDTLQKESDHRLVLLKEIKRLMTSMQENWREQYLFDIYDLIEEELELDAQRQADEYIESESAHIEVGDGN